MCVDVEITQPLKVEVNIKEGNGIKSSLFNYENLTDICYGCGQPNHEFENCPLFLKSFSFQIEKSLDVVLKKKEPVDDQSELEKQGQENWVEINPN